MAFAGYLLKVNGSTFPHKFIKLDTYTIDPNQVQDGDNTYEDGNGKLHRDILPHRRTKVEFTTPHINESENRELQALFPNTETVTVDYWNPRKGIYETGTCYTPNLNFQVYKISASDITYNPIRIAFIEY
jgi:hypothetical protein